MFEKIVKIGTLFDFYGKLLSKNQYIVINLYYIHDLSLAEIGKELGITRQGVYDTLRRAEGNLYNFEEKLKLVEKFDKVSGKINSVLEYIGIIIDEAEKVGNEKILNNANSIESIVKKIVNE